MAKLSGFERLLGWLRGRPANADVDPADFGATYGMELCLHAQHAARRSPGRDLGQCQAPGKPQAMTTEQCECCTCTSQL